jgi:hypothetical protein
MFCHRQGVDEDERELRAPLGKVKVRGRRAVGAQAPVPPARQTDTIS